MRGFIVGLLLVVPLLPAATGDYRKQPDGIVLQTAEGSLKVEVVTDTIVRVTFAKSAILFTRGTSAVLPHNAAVKWTLSEANGAVTLTTASLQARVERQTGRVSFLDAAGKPILAEAAGGHVLENAEVQGEQTYHARQLWQANDDESLYGLGQQQLGTVDIKGYDMDLWQRNTRVVVPMLVSSRGYGIFWDNMSYTRFGDLRPFVPIPADTPAPDIHPGGRGGGRVRARRTLIGKVP